MEVHPFSIDHLSVPSSARWSGVTVNQKCCRPRGSLAGTMVRHTVERIAGSISHPLSGAGYSRSANALLADQPKAEALR
jgi:hypothetical protein